MAKRKVTAKFKNAAITAVYVFQVRRKKNSAKKHTHPVLMVAAKLLNDKLPTGPTNPWIAEFNTKGVGQHRSALRVLALDKDGGIIAFVALPDRKHP